MGTQYFLHQYWSTFIYNGVYLLEFGNILITNSAVIPFISIKIT